MPITEAFFEERVIAVREHGCAIHFSAESSNTGFVFRTVDSANQLSIYGAVVNWCQDLAHQIVAILHGERRTRDVSNFTKFQMFSPGAPGNVVRQQTEKNRTFSRKFSII